MSLPRSEMKELGKQEDSTYASLMMMWSVALTGSKPCQAPSLSAILAVQALRSSLLNTDGTGTYSSMDYLRELLRREIQGISQPGECIPKRQRKKIAPTMDPSIILKLATWLLKRTRSGA